MQTRDNIIIYGHHIKNNKMFGELEKYKKKEFYNNNKVINFNTIYDVRLQKNLFANEKTNSVFLRVCFLFNQTFHFLVGVRTYIIFT